ncbi:hypothetical protein, partial [Klebsiella pneumoniae]|uniref:hypothetical protein n=1 Tax=Klebsiella pneumoniae TaxID=573 RepID=UPI0013D83F9A
GCGGEPHAQAGASVIDGNWRIEALNGRLVPRSTGGVASTKMACLDRGRNLQEQAILGLLGERLTVSGNRAGEDQLAGARGRT